MVIMTRNNFTSEENLTQFFIMVLLVTLQKSTKDPLWGICYLVLKMVVKIS